VIGSSGVRLLDFGIARAVGGFPSDPQTLGRLATLHYAAPEQLEVGQRVDHRADLYAFGVIAFEMLAGQPPYVGDRAALEHQHRACAPPALRDVRSVPDELDELVQACLAKRVESRPKHADELRQRIADALATTASPRTKSLGRHCATAVAWIQGGETAEIVRAITSHHGVVARGYGDVVIAAFCELDHDAPLAAALAVADQLARDGVRVAVHLGSALVRRSPAGKPAVYGPLVDRAADWLPPPGLDGVVLTEAAARGCGGSPIVEVPGFFRRA